MFIETPTQIEEFPVIEDVTEILDDQNIGNEKEEVEEVFIENPDTGAIEVMKKITRSKKKVIKHIIQQSEGDEGPQPVEITEIFDTSEEPKDRLDIDEQNKLPENEVAKIIQPDTEEKPLKLKKKGSKSRKSEVEKPVEEEVKSFHEVLFDKPDEKSERVTEVITRINPETGATETIRTVRTNKVIKKIETEDEQSLLPLSRKPSSQIEITEIFDKPQKKMEDDEKIEEKLETIVNPETGETEIIKTIIRTNKKVKKGIAIFTDDDEIPYTIKKPSGEKPLEENIEVIEGPFTTTGQDTDTTTIMKTVRKKKKIITRNDKDENMAEQAQITELPDDTTTNIEEIRDSKDESEKPTTIIDELVTPRKTDVAIQGKDELEDESKPEKKLKTKTIRKVIKKKKTIESSTEPEKGDSMQDDITPTLISEGTEKQETGLKPRKPIESVIPKANEETVESSVDVPQVLEQPEESVVENIRTSKITKRKISLKTDDSPQENPAVEDDIPSVTYIPRRSKTTEEIEQDFNIQIQTYGDEDITLKGKVKLARRKSYSKEEISVTDVENIPQDDSTLTENLLPFMEKMKPTSTTEEEDTTVKIQKPSLREGPTKTALEQRKEKLPEYVDKPVEKLSEENDKIIEIVEQKSLPEEMLTDENTPEVIPLEKLDESLESIAGEILKTPLKLEPDNKVVKKLIKKKKHSITEEIKLEATPTETQGIEYVPKDSEVPETIIKKKRPSIKSENKPDEIPARIMDSQDIPGRTETITKKIVKKKRLSIKEDSKPEIVQDTKDMPDKILDAVTVQKRASIQDSNKYEIHQENLPDLSETPQESMGETSVPTKASPVQEDFKPEVTSAEVVPQDTKKVVKKVIKRKKSLVKEDSAPDEIPKDTPETITKKRPSLKEDTKPEVMEDETPQQIETITKKVIKKKEVLDKNDIPDVFEEIPNLKDEPEESIRGIIVKRPSLKDDDELEMTVKTTKVKETPEGVETITKKVVKKKKVIKEDTKPEITEEGPDKKDILEDSIVKILVKKKPSLKDDVKPEDIAEETKEVRDTPEANETITRKVIRKKKIESDFKPDVVEDIQESRDSPDETIAEEDLSANKPSSTDDIKSIITTEDTSEVKHIPEQIEEITKKIIKKKKVIAEQNEIPEITEYIPGKTDSFQELTTDIIIRKRPSLKDDITPKVTTEEIKEEDIPEETGTNIVKVIKKKKSTIESDIKPEITEEVPDSKDSPEESISTTVVEKRQTLKDDTQPVVIVEEIFKANDTPERTEIIEKTVTKKKRVSVISDAKPEISEEIPNIKDGPQKPTHPEIIPDEQPPLEDIEPRVTPEEILSIADTPKEAEKTTKKVIKKKKVSVESDTKPDFVEDIPSKKGPPEEVETEITDESKPSLKYVEPESTLEKTEVPEKTKKVVKKVVKKKRLSIKDDTKPEVPLEEKSEVKETEAKIIEKKRPSLIDDQNPEIAPSKTLDINDKPEEIGEVEKKIIKKKRPSLKEEVPEKQRKLRKPSLKDTADDKPTFESSKPSESTPKEPSAEEVQVEKRDKESSPEEVSVSFTPRKTKKTEEVEQNFNIQVHTYGEEDITMRGKVKLPRKKPTSVMSEEVSIDLTEDDIPSESLDDFESKPDETSTETVTVKEVKPREQETTLKKQMNLMRRKSQPLDDELSESVVLAKPKQLPDEDISDSVIFKPKKSKKKEDTEQEYDVKLRTYAEEDVSLSGKVKVSRRESTSEPIATDDEFSLILDEDKPSDTESTRPLGHKPKGRDEIIEEDVVVTRRKSKQFSTEEMTEESTVAFKPRQKKKEEKEDNLVEEKVVISKKKRHSIVEDVVSSSEIKIPTRRKSSYAVEDNVEETFQVNIAKSIPERKEEICEEESFDFKVRRKSSVPTFHRQGICPCHNCCKCSISMLCFYSILSL